jgi:hypothetical protein
MYEEGYYGGPHVQDGWYYIALGFFTCFTESLWSIMNAKWFDPNS